MPNKNKKTQNSTPHRPQGRDLFQTPNYATDLLIPFIPKHITRIWEPAAGELKIVRRLEKAGYDVVASDIRTIFGTDQYNFITDDARSSLNRRLMKEYAIITNPPFSLKRQFYETCMWYANQYQCPWALLIPADYSGWLIKAVDVVHCEKIVPTRRIDYITPSGLSGASGHTSNFHSMWLTHGFELGQSETYVELTNQEKRINI